MTQRAGYISGFFGSHRYANIRVSYPFSLRSGSSIFLRSELHVTQVFVVVTYTDQRLSSLIGLKLLDIYPSAVAPGGSGDKAPAL
ncbi:hypothetical protein RRG08_019322 [Elysia crispata]|uniref:Uncharacterized protein n=1 Tax=Elysia crispata TaxID=231223 RepID=A0AAE1AMK6_9GAST|nr:hypothetical protein RRG08_019322 [Elysia crispata]